jgi:NAD-dependent deacetylase
VTRVDAILRGTMSLEPEVLAPVAQALREAESILFITGAGISADSGLPTYRGVGGLYQDRQTDEGVPIEVALSGPVFRARPEVSWRHIRAIEAACRGARPNAAHAMIAALERRKPRVWTLTQNVDGLHRAAGAQNVIEIHGTVHRLFCPGCGWDEQVEDYAHLPEGLPRCPRCARVIRPDVVLFEEALPGAALARLEEEVERGFDLVFSVGTSSLFPYIAAPVLELGSRGAVTVEINPGETELSARVDHHLRAGAAAALGALV